MQRQIYLCLLFVLLVRSETSEEPKRKGNGKKPMNDDDEVVDESAIFSTYADNRYSPYDSATTASTPRSTRTRWSTPATPVFADDVDDHLERARFMTLESPNLGPTCYSVVDMNHPLLADTCGALPQARYNLPNVFGHRERWQIELFLHGLISASGDLTCLRSLRLLLCPLLFPPCPSRVDTTPVLLPCQTFCRMVKTQCAIPALDFLPCEVLPMSSDLCPTNQVYNAFFSRGQTGIPSPSPRQNAYSPPAMSTQEVPSWNNFHAPQYSTDQLGTNPTDYSSLPSPTVQRSMGRPGSVPSSAHEIRRTPNRI